jgi:hypothetical protein
VLAIALPIIAYGLIFNLGIAAAGGVLVILAGFGFGYEPSDDPEAHGPHGPHGDGHDDGQAHAGDGPGDEPELPSESGAGAAGGQAEAVGVASTASASDEPTTEGKGGDDG